MLHVHTQVIAIDQFSSEFSLILIEFLLSAHRLLPWQLQRIRDFHDGEAEGAAEGVRRAVGAQVPYNHCRPDVL